MPSRISGWLMIALVELSLGSAMSRAQDLAAQSPSESEVQQVMAALKQDPNLATERTLRTLKWRSDDKPTPAKPERLRSLSWLTAFFQWLAQGSRILLWMAVAIAAAWLMIFLIRVLRKWRRPPAATSTALPTHVRELDIRPESLPEDIGAAAWALWRQGAQRQALSLLYRGLLSRLVHQHGVPIRDSSTEAECLQLTQPRVGTECAAYTARLLKAWQRAIYGAQTVPDDELQMLCGDFDRALLTAMEHNA